MLWHMTESMCPYSQQESRCIFAVFFKLNSLNQSIFDDDYLFQSDYGAWLYKTYLNARNS